jgi:8-oxo-dGTP pyrophosphatase MutT (NUDIX family)
MLDAIYVPNSSTTFPQFKTHHTQTTHHTHIPYQHFPISQIRSTPTQYITAKAFQSLAFKGHNRYISSFLKKSPPNKTYGGILCIKTGDSQVKYALVQGRYTEKWSFPKGHINKGETAFECSFREISEETGIELLPEPTEYMKIGYGHYYIFHFDKEVPLIPTDTNEIMDARWVTLDEMAGLSLNADVSLFRKKILDAYNE